MPKQGDLRVWWIPQIPGETFEVAVASVEEGALLLDTLARYDRFQFKNKVKPDYSNAGGLQVYDEGEWIDWEDPEEFIDIDEWMNKNKTREKQRDLLFDRMNKEVKIDE